MPPDRLKPLHDEAVVRLKEAGCDTPALDARLLLESATGLTRETLILDPSREVGTAEAERFRELIRRRADREPVSRIIGAREFYGRRFRVTPAVLDPRPDTETLVEAALTRMPPSARVLDLGTGSGAIIVTLLAERSDATGLATDISSEALAVAGRMPRHSAWRSGSPFWKPPGSMASASVLTSSSPIRPIFPGPTSRR